MEVIMRRCAGLDIHKASVWACVLTLDDQDRSHKTIRKFGTTTHELRNLRKWLSAQGVTHVAAESTGVYWKPIWNVLEEGPFKLLLCNAHHLKQVPGRKTDARDCEWIAHLLRHGLLRGSFVPSRGLRELRDLTRLRVKTTGEKSAAANRLQKVLEDANVKLSSVASDVLGKSGRAMIEALIEGEDDPRKLAQLARKRLRAKLPQLRFALEGVVTEHHRFMLRLLYDQVLHAEAVLERLDERIAELTGSAADGANDRLAEDDQTLPLFPEPPPDADDADDKPPPDGGDSSPAAAPNTPPPLRGRSTSGAAGPPQEPRGAARPAPDGPGLFPAAVSLLCTVPGIGQRTAENVLAEIGDDMSRFPTSAHLASWAGVCPGNNRSAGKQTKRMGKTTKGNRYLKRALNQAAWGAIRVKASYYSAQYKRLSHRRGKKRAVVAVSHSILVTIWHMLSTGQVYKELGSDYFERINADRLTAYHQARLEKLGYDVSLSARDTEAA